MSVRLAFLAAAAMVALAAPTTNATHFCSTGTPIDFAGFAYVVVHEFLGEEYMLGVWVYVESNGEAGLQRGGRSILGGADPCQDSANPDQAVA